MVGTRSRISIPVRIVMAAFGAVIVLYVGSVIVMSTAWFQRHLLRWVATSLENVTGARVEVSRFEVRPVIFQATLYGLVLHGNESASEPPLFRSRVVILGINPLTVARHRVLLRRLDMEGAEVHLHTYPDGSTNLPGPKSRLLDDLLNLSIGTLTIAGADLFWDDRHVPAELDARDVAVLLRYGRDHRYQGSVASAVTRLETRRWSLPPITFATRLEFSRSELLLTAIDWRIAPSTGIGAVSGHGSLSFRKLPNLEAGFTLQARGDLLRAAQVLRIPELRGGGFDWEGQGVYREGKLEAQGRIQVRQVAVRSASFESHGMDFTADYSVDGPHITLSKLTASLLGGTAKGRAEMTLEGFSPKSGALRVELSGLDLEGSLHALSGGQVILAPMPMASHVAGALQASWRGAFRDFRSKFDLTFSPFEGPRGSRPVYGFARGNATLNKGVSLDFETAEFHTAHSSLTAKGLLGGQKSNLAVELSTSDFEEWRPLAESVFGAPQNLPLALKSSAAFSGSVDGSIDRPEIRGRMKIGPFEYSGWTWTGLEGSVDAAPDLLHVSAGKLLGGNSALAFDVSAGLEEWKFTPQSAVKIRAQAEHTSLDGLSRTLNIHTPVVGLVTGRLNLEGSRSNLSGSGAVRIEQGVIAEEPFDLLSANVQLAGSRWTLEAIELRKASGRLTGRASLDSSTGGFSLELHGTDFSLAGFKVLESRLHVPSLKQEGLDGRIDLDLQGEGTIQNPQLRAIYAVRDLALNGSPLGNLRGQVEWHGQQAQLKAELQGQGGRLQLEGATETCNDWPSHLTAQYSDLHADFWIGLFGGRKIGAALISTGSLSITGPLKDPDRLQAQTQASKLEVGFAPDLIWKNDRPVELTYTSGVLTASRFELRGPATDLQIEGSAHLTRPATLSCSIQGHGGAELLKVLDPALESRGSLDLKLRATGRLVQPSLNGTLAVEGLSVSYGDLPFRMAGLNGQVEFEGDRFTLRSLRGAGGGGSIELSGFGTLYGTPKLDLQASLDQARIEFPAEITSSLTGTLRLVGTPQGGQLTGDLSVRRMFVSEDFNLLAWVGRLGGQAFVQPAGFASPFASKVRLDVGVTTSPEVRLESHDLTVVATVDMNLQGTLANPVGFGDIHVQSGEAVIRGDRYKLTRGDISMTNPFRTQAVVDLEAETRIQHYNLTLDVTGAADRLKLSYRSDPPLPTTDILALLALGYSRQEQTLRATGSSQTFGTLGASALLSQALSTQVSGRIQRLFGVSRIKIDPNVYGPGVGAGPRVTVEEQVTRDFTVTYSTNTSGSQQRLIQIEYALSDRVSLLGERDQNGVFGVEVRFRHRFR